MSSVRLARVEAGPRTAIKLEQKLAVENANRAAHALGAGGSRECAHPRGRGQQTRRGNAEALGSIADPYDGLTHAIRAPALARFG